MFQQCLIEKILFNRLARWRSPYYDVFSSRLPGLQVVPFFQEGMMRVDRGPKSDVRSVSCYFLSNGHNRPSSRPRRAASATSAAWCGWSPVRPCCRRRRRRSRGESVYAAAPTTPGFCISYAPPSLPLKAPSPPPPPLQSPSLPSPLFLTPPKPPPLPTPFAARSLGLLGVAGNHHLLLEAMTGRRILGGGGAYRVFWRQCWRLGGT